MLLVSTLEEATAELAQRTRYAWTPLKVLEFALFTRVDLHAAAPLDAVAVTYQTIDENGRAIFKEIFRSAPGSESLVRLFPWQVAQLIERRSVEASHVTTLGERLEGQIICLARPALVTVDQVRIKRDRLAATLKSWDESQVRPGPFITKAGDDGVQRTYSIRERWPPWVFEGSPIRASHDAVEAGDIALFSASAMVVKKPIDVIREKTPQARYQEQCELIGDGIRDHSKTMLVRMGLQPNESNKGRLRQHIRLFTKKSTKGQANDPFGVASPKKSGSSGKAR